MKTSAERTKGEVLTPLQRFAALAPLVAMVVLFCFFAIHQVTNTGYLTSAFGPLEMLSLYVPIVVAFAAPIVRVITGRQNSARPFEAATNVCLALGSLWLAVMFPFNFAHLADVFPGPVRFLVSWITNDIGRWVLVLQVVIGLIITPLTIATFFSVRRRSPAI